MDVTHNIFISHYGKHDEHVQALKQRLKDNGYDVRNSSIDSTKHTDGKIPPDPEIQKKLKDAISWAGTFICLIGPETHTRWWVNYEIRQAHLQGKRIVGVYLHGSSDNVQLPEAFKRYGGTPLGWNSLDKLGDAMSGLAVPAENPDGTPREPIYTVKRIRC